MNEAYAKKLSLPSGWVEKLNQSNGRTYYVNTISSTSTYSDPRLQPLPPGWELKWDSKKSKPYFSDRNTRTTTYTDPRFPQTPPKAQSTNTASASATTTQNTTSTAVPAYVQSSSSIPSYAQAPSNPSPEASSIPSYARAPDTPSAPIYASTGSRSLPDDFSDVPPPPDDFSDVPPPPDDNTNILPKNSNRKNAPANNQSQNPLGAFAQNFANSFLAGFTGMNQGGMGMMAGNQPMNQGGYNYTSNQVPSVNAAGAQQSNPGELPRITINGKLCDAQEIQILKQAGSPCIPGDYWYDKSAGGIGYTGGPCLMWWVPGLNVGGPMRPDCSNGTTGVFINGRQLNSIDVMNWNTYIGPCLPGRYILDGMGNISYENGMYIANVYAAMSAKNKPKKSTSFIKDYSDAKFFLG